VSAFVCIHITWPLTNLNPTSDGTVCCYLLSKTDTAGSVLAEVELHCAGNWVSLTKTNDNNWLGDRLGVTTDTMARKLKLVASFERRQGTQRFPSVHKRDDRYGTPPAAWIYVKKADEDVPELTDWLTNKGDGFRQGQGRRMDRYTCTRSRLQHLSRKQKEAYRVVRKRTMRRTTRSAGACYRRRRCQYRRPSSPAARLRAAVIRLCRQESLRQPWRSP